MQLKKGYRLFAVSGQVNKVLRGEVDKRDV